ncbi:hypothetical protein ACQR13_20845 [Bradyrhizobium sp. HKCCYLRH3059]|uniref:hypothetical protein n=1 Tax=Bradyrhizobium sp. HKCCYLRH3059 TaxID=3420745 RepID=UPI003EB80F4D
MTADNNQERNPDEDRRSLEPGQVFVSWRLLRSIGNSRAAKLTVLIPLIGYLILLNDSVVRRLALSTEIFGPPTDAALTKLLLIYCGLVSVAVASTIFAIWCYPEVKRYGSPEEYVAGEEPFLSSRTIGIIQHRLRTGDEIARTYQAGYRQLHESRPSTDDREVRLRRIAEATRIDLNLYFEMLDRSRPVARWTAAILYLAGLALLLIPSATVFLKVLTVLFHKLAGA